MKKNSITKTFAAQTVLTLILAMFTSIGAWAGDITYTATSGTDGYSFENYGNLVDGDKSSKWCVNSGSPYIEFYSSSPIIPTGYVMTTAADTYPDNLGRNPKRLVIKAKANGSDSWTTLTDVTNDDLVPFKNTTDCTYKLSNTNTYQYFRLEFTSRNNTELQLAEFAFLIAPENVSVSSTTTTMTNGTYQVDSNVTISERIQISGTVNLILGEGATLTANDGIEVPTGATLIIDGTGSLVAQASNNDVEGNGQAGIGARVSFGNIIINGGNVTAKGKNGGAGIGGNRHASSGGDIIINGGVVNATGSTYFISTYDKRYGAGIGGGATNWGGNYGYFKSVIINGGQVTADRIGNSGNNPNGSFGTLVMGWTNYTDFIKADTYSATTMSFAEGKLFMLDGTTTIATTSNINGKKIVPLRYSITDATVSGISSTYNYTGSPININYTVTYNDNTLSAGTDYTATITKDGVNVTEVKDAGNYTLTLTGKDLYMNTKSVNFSVVALSLTSASISGIEPTYYFADTPINLSYTVTHGGTTLTKGTDYTAKITKGTENTEVTTITKAGNYTLTITGIGNYTGSKSITFVVESYIKIGNADSSISDCPTDVKNKYSLSQQIYTTTELGAAKTIKSISFFNTKQGCSRNLEIYMTLTDRSSYVIDSGGYYVEEWVPVDTTEDLVFRGNVTFLKDDWTEIPLDMPFVYDGQHNVAIMIYDKTAVVNSSSLNFRAYSVDTYQSADASSSYPEYNPKRPANGHGTKQKNQLLLSIDDLPTCFKPHDIAIDYTGGETASLSWANGSEGQTAWQICINDGKSDRIIDVTTNPYTLTGLEFATNYAIKMRTNCGDGDYSDWTNAINFATDFCERENMCNISFDLTSSLGYLWLDNAIEVVDAQTGFLLGRVSNYATSSELYIPVTSHDVVLVPAGREIQFRWVKGDDPNYCSWAIYDVNGDELFSGAGNYNMNTGTILYTYTVDCTSNPYKMPTELTCTKVTGTTATLNWTEKGSATAWQICLDDDENNLINVSTIPYTLNGLTPEKTYTAKVRAYGSDGQSRWTNNISFLPSDKRVIGSDTDNYTGMPTATYQNYSVSEQIYTTAELGSAGIITSIDFYNSATQCTRKLDIYMVHTDKSSFYNDETSSYEWGNVRETDKVFSGDVTFTKDVWTTIELDKVFSYDGQHNVMLVVDDNTGSSTNAAAFKCYTSLNENYKMMAVATSGSDYAPTNMPSYCSYSNFKNQIRIGVAKEGEVLRPGFLTCTGITGSTATLSWTENGTATAWQLCLNDDENNLINVTTNPCTLTGLSADVIYTAKVRAVSGDKHSEWSASVSFEPTSKRSIGSGTDTSYYIPTATYSATYLSEQIYSKAEMGSAGIISSIDFYNISTPCTRNLDIYMFHTTKSSFTQPSEYIPVTAADKVFSGNVDFLQNKWTTIEFDDFFNYNGEQNVMLVVHDKTGRTTNQGPIYFRVFSGDGNQSDYYSYYSSSSYDPEETVSGGSMTRNKNQIRLGYATGSSVPRPKDLVCKDFSLNTATLSWTESCEATSWQICLNNDENHLINTDMNPLTIVNLAPGSYTAKVRAVSSNEVSDWSKSVSFGPLGKICIGTNTDGQYIIPIYSSTPYSMSEQIYTGEEIGTAGAGAGTITSIDFFNTSPEQARDLDIYLVHTDKSFFNNPSEYISVSEADLVFSGNVTFLQGDWTVINFDKDFSYDGKSNVAVVVDDNTGSRFQGQPVYCSSFSTYDYQAVYQNGDSNYDPAKPLSGGMIPYKNHIRLGFTPSISSTIPRPTELACTGYTTTTATLSWTENGSATTWEICLNDDDEHPITANTNPYTLTGLTEETAYTAKVRAVTNGEGSYWSSKVSFQPSEKIRIGTGEAAHYYLPISTASYYCMSEQIYTASDIGMAGTITSLDFFNRDKECSRNLDIYMVYTDKSNFDDYRGVGATKADLVFSGNVTFNERAWSTIYLDSPFEYDGQRNVVLIVDDNTSNSSGSSNYFYTYDAGAYQALFYNYDTHLDPTSSEILERSGSRYSVKNQLRLGITSGTVTMIPRPNALTCTDDSPTTATLSWTERGNATKWQICVNDDEENLITVTTHPYTLNDLTEEMRYTAKVRAVTADDGVSRWSEKVKFHPSVKINIGCGTYTDYFLPSFLNSKYSMSQQIYTAAEIGTAGTISSIDFYNAGSERSRNLDIYLVSSNKNNFESGSDWISVTAADKVFSGEVIFAQDAWTPIVLNTSFVYDGQNNVVLVVDDNTEDNYYGLDFETFDATGQALLFSNSYDNNINFDPTDPGTYSGTVKNVKNHIRIGITQPAVAGDVNGDGSVTIKDAIAVANYILTNGYPSGNFVFSAADMNGDKAITISDAVAIVNKILTGKE